MVFLLFYEDAGKPVMSHKRTKSLYLPQMMYDPKNKGTLFSSTLKIAEKRALIFMIRAHPDELWFFC